MAHKGYDQDARYTDMFHQFSALRDICLLHHIVHVVTVVFDLTAVHCLSGSDSQSE